jgi:hypothetical protein
MDREELIRELNHLAEQISGCDDLATYLRHQRDDIFVNAYQNRLMSVTDMGTFSGMRRESVHEAINRAKKRQAKQEEIWAT